MGTLVQIKQGHPVVSSKKIAEAFSKVHRNVTRDIKNLDCSDDFRVRNFTLPLTRHRRTKFYRVTK